MCKKVKDIIERCLNIKYFFGKIFLVFFICTILINCIIITAQKKWEVFDYYPEEEYQILEAEVDRMVKNQDFKTEYYLEINYYNNESDYILFSLEENTAILNVTVENYQKDNQTITIERKFKNKTQQIIQNKILPMVIIAAGISFTGILTVAALAGVIYIIVSVIEKIISKLSKE